MDSYLYVETNWPCVSPHGQGPCEGRLIAISSGNTYSVSCNKCNLGVTGFGSLPQFWITRLIEHGYLRQLKRRPVEKESLGNYLREKHWFDLTLQELVDSIIEKFEVFHRE